MAAKIPDSKPEAREPPATTAPKVLAAVTLRQQNLRPPLLARPPALPPKPKLRQVRAVSGKFASYKCVATSTDAAMMSSAQRTESTLWLINADTFSYAVQHHYEFLSDWRRHQMALAAAAGSRPALTALPVDVVRAPSLLPPMPRLPASSAPSLGDDSGQTADLEAAIAAVLRAGNPPQQPGGATDVHTGVRPPDPAPQASADGLDASCLPGRLEGALGSGLYRLPSDAQLLSFASCIAA